jgi:predicted 3-demethylubiquinone-9 3-methyltransferase (glyoxalase superfamily)
MQKITPCLWFDFCAEEAVDHYLRIFKKSKKLQISHYGESMPELKGKVLTIHFELEGQIFLALNGGPQFPFTEAISLSVDCQTQTEIDELTQHLSVGGEIGPCGWLKDRFGLSWQIVPSALSEMMSSKDSVAVDRLMAALLKMKKLNIDVLRTAFEGRS